MITLPIAADDGIDVTTPLASGDDVDGLSLPVLIAVAVGATLVLILAVGVACYMRRRANLPKTVEEIALGLQRKSEQDKKDEEKKKKDKKKKSRAPEPVSDAFQPYDHVSAVETTTSLGEKPDDAGDDDAVIDASVLALAQQLAVTPPPLADSTPLGIARSLSFSPSLSHTHTHTHTHSLPLSLHLSLSLTRPPQP